MRRAPPRVMCVHWSLRELSVLGCCVLVESCGDLGERGRCELEHGLSSQYRHETSECQWQKDGNQSLRPAGAYSKVCNRISHIFVRSHNKIN